MTRILVTAPFTRVGIIKIKDRTVIQRYLPLRIKTTLAAHRAALKTNG
jgi:hypothetical protein